MSHDSAIADANNLARKLLSMHQMHVLLYLRCAALLCLFGQHLDLCIAHGVSAITCFRNAWKSSFISNTFAKQAMR